MSLKDDLLRLYAADLAAMRGAENLGDRITAATLKGRVQGLERAMSLVGIDYDPVSKIPSLWEAKL